MARPTAIPGEPLAISIVFPERLTTQFHQTEDDSCRAGAIIQSLPQIVKVRSGPPIEAFSRSSLSLITCGLEQGGCHGLKQKWMAAGDTSDETAIVTRKSITGSAQKRLDSSCCIHVERL